MTYVDINDAGDLSFFFKEIDNEARDMIMVHTLPNGSELEIMDDEVIALVLPNFRQKLNMGDITNSDISLENIELVDDMFIFHLNVYDKLINGRVDLVSLKE